MMNQDERNTLAYLSRALQLGERIDHDVERSQTIRTLMLSASAGALTEMQTKALASELAELEARLIEDVDVLVDLKAETKRQIEWLPDVRMQLVLELRHLCGQTWGQVASTLNLRPADVHRLHKSAARCFSRMVAKQGLVL